MEMEFKDNSRRRRLLIVLGVVLAVVAGGAAFYLSSQQPAPAAAEVPMRTVIIAATDIPAHTVIESGHLTQRSLPDDPSLAQAVTDPQQVLGRLTGVGVYANQPIMPNLLAMSAAGAKFSILAPNEVVTDTSPHWRAVSIDVPDERAVGGQLVANQRVDVVVTAQVNVLKPESAAGGQGGAGQPVAGGQLPANGASANASDCKLRPYTQSSGKGATQANCTESDIFYTDKSSKVTYQDVLVLSKNETQYVLKVDERVAEEISHLQAAGNSSFSVILRPDGDARQVDTSTFGETTNSIIEKYGLPVPEAYPRP